MLGSEKLIKIGIDKYSNGDSNERMYLLRCYDEFLQNTKDDWLINLLCEYSRFEFPSVGEAFWYGRLKNIVADGNLYMGLIEIPHYAFPDKCRSENYALLESAGISITDENKWHYDGIFSIPEKERLYKIYQTDEHTPENIEFVDVKIDYGRVEFGTQNLCKSVMCLLEGQYLLRVPYGDNLKFKNPVCAIFYNRHYDRHKNE